MSRRPFLLPLYFVPDLQYPIGVIDLSDNRQKDKRKSAKKKRMGTEKKLLLVIWIVFIVCLGIEVTLIIKNKDTLMKDLGFTKTYIYEENANEEINQLIQKYYSAYSSCDQKVLQSLVVDPSRFDDMYIVEQKATVVTGYSNLKVYTIPGLTPDATIVYVMKNLQIANVVSQPLDIVTTPMYVLKTDKGYLIDNTPLSTDIMNRFEELNQKEDIQALFRMVKEDQERCLREDETFKSFYDKLYP